MSEYRIISRSEWGARHKDGVGTQTLPVRFGFFHHSVTPSAGPNATLAEDVRRIRTVEDVGNARFGTMSYTFLVTEAGRIFAGLSQGRIGAHTAGYNTRGIAISFVGNYEANRPTKKMLDAAAWLIRDLERRGVVTRTAAWRGHHQVAATACPGKHLKPHLQSIVSSARAIEPKEEADVLDCFEITVICMTLSALGRLRGKCASLGLAAPSVIEVVEKTVYVAKTHARKEPGTNKAEELQAYVKSDRGMIAFKGIPTTAETVASLGVVREGTVPAPITCAVSSWKISEQTASRIVLTTD